MLANAVRQGRTAMDALQKCTNIKFSNPRLQRLLESKDATKQDKNGRSNRFLNLPPKLTERGRQGRRFRNERNASAVDRGVVAVRNPLDVDTGSRLAPLPPSPSVTNQRPRLLHPLPKLYYLEAPQAPTLPHRH